MENNFVEFVQISIDRYNEMSESKKKIEVELEVSKAEYEMLETKYEMIKRALIDAYNEDHKYSWVNVRAEIIKSAFGLEDDKEVKDE